MRSGRLDLATASPETFLPHVGTLFEVSREHGAGHVVRLVEVEVPASGSAPRGTHFVLAALGRPTGSFGQGTYALRHAHLGRFRLFVVPVGIPRDPRSYQAVIAHV
jgi:hypothetical protein